MTTATEVSAPTKTNFVAVPWCILRCLDRTPINLYVHNVARRTFVLFRQAGYHLTEERAAYLADSCSDVLHVRTCDFGELSEQLSGSLDSILERESLSPTERFVVLQTAVAVDVEQAVRLTHNDRLVALASRIGQQLTSLLSRDDVLAGDLFGMARHDYSTYVHVTNVTSYAVLLAERLGIRDTALLEEIAIGAMLHDVGKRFIPNSILNKPAALDKQEREVIEDHPRRGYVELLSHEDVTSSQLMIAYQHHEHVDGNGYPVGILADEIHCWAKLLAVVDVFEALTGKRPYRRAASQEEALGFLESRCGAQFDPEIVACWTSAMRQK